MLQPKAGWTDEYSLDQTLEIYKRLALEHLNGVKGVTAALLRDSITRERWADVLKVKLSYDQNDDVHDLIEIRQALGFFQKLEDLDIGVDKIARARDKFYESEKRCEQTNDLFAAYLRGGLSLIPRFERIISAARRKIQKVLGPAPRLSELRMRHGPGASTNVKKPDAAAVEKFAAGFECSENLYRSGLLPVILRQVPHWTEAHTTRIYVDEDGFLCASVPLKLNWGKLGFAPKNAEIYRVTVKEPPLNMFLQLGLGDKIGDKLNCVGVDIKDQSRNQRFAFLGSLTGEYVTLDLVSASDTIARQFVRAVLPDDWFFLLDSARSSTIYDRWGVKGYRDVHLQKFSSMGNGFTFPLQTLIFWALTTSFADPKRVAVYGDDITCPVENAGDVMAVLEYCGFEVNISKSFVSGPFRESCGADYFRGIDIRPYYAKHLASAATLFTLHNFYIQNFEYGKAAVVRDYIHPDLRIWGPKGYGDGHLHYLPGGPRPVPSPSFTAKGWAGYSFDTFIKTPVRKKTKYVGDWVTPLYATYLRGEPESAPEQHADSHLYLADPRTIEWETAPFQAASIKMEEEIETVRFSSTKKDGRPKWTYPGFEGYSKVSIYTLG